MAEAIGPHTTMVVIGYANNEVGTIQPVAEIGAVCRERNVRYVVDATQAAASLPIDVNDLQADVMGISAHKIEGPKGVGALFIRQGTNLIPQQSGGIQERQRRAGTENVAGAVGLAAALRWRRGAESGMADEADRQRGLRDRLIGRLGEIADGELTGHPPRACRTAAAGRSAASRGATWSRPSTSRAWRPRPAAPAPREAPSRAMSWPPWASRPSGSADPCA